MSRDSRVTTSASLLRIRTSIDELTPADRALLFDRSTSADTEIRRATSEIIALVRESGDAALRSLARHHDRVDLESIEVSREARVAALEALDPALRRAMERAATNIATVHAAGLPGVVTVTPEPGLTIARRPDPLSRVGVYAPGGRAAYPSSVLMSAVPARIAGVGEVILCSPPNRSGRPSDVVLAAAEIAGVDRVFAIGGAGAVAAMAFGTETVPRVDRVVGPGNAYVAEAKLQLGGHVGVDLPAGPSELCVIADPTCDPAAVALELLAQAEHDPLACVVAVTIEDETADAVARALEELIVDQPRRAIIEESLQSRGAIVSARSIEQAIAFANEYAPEHLLLVVDAVAEVIPALRNAGTIFVGASTSVSFGDYLSGANHVLPTGGLARAYSGLSVADFFRWTTIQTATPLAAGALADDVARFAEAEALPGHALAARRAGANT
jgi:histidinol dehydrogenase